MDSEFLVEYCDLGIDDFGGVIFWLGSVNVVWALATR
jgi:hypothetical protein